MTIPLSVKKYVQPLWHATVCMLLVMCCACQPQIPGGVMSEGQLEDLLYDYTLALSMADQATLQEGQDHEMLRYQYVQKVFQEHGITEEYFDSTMVWYSAEGKRIAGVFQRLNERLDAEAKTMGVDLSETEIYASYTLDGDTANVWNGRQIVYLQNYQPENLKIITIPADSTFLPGDSFKFAFNSHFLPSSTNRILYALFSVYYADSSVVSQTQTIGGDYKAELNLIPRGRQDTLQPQRLVVTLYAPPAAQDQPYELFFMTYPSVLRIHHKAEPVADTLPADSLAAQADSLASDSLSDVRPEDEPARRLSPLEERDMREQRHDIQIVKERIQQPRRAARPVRRRKM